MSYHSVLLIIYVIIAVNYCLVWQYSTVTSSLLSSKYAAFIGNLNSRIFILGGSSNQGTDLIEYNIGTATYTKHNNSFNFGSQSAQSSIQNNDILYMLPAGDRNINVFNLTSFTITEIIDGTSHINKPDSRCLLYYKGYLMVIGGYQYSSVSSLQSKQFILYDISNKGWLAVTQVPVDIYGASCQIVNDVLYLIGGYSSEGGGNLDTVLTIDVSGIPNIDGSWHLITATLSESRRYHRSISVNDVIYVVGGWYGYYSSSIYRSSVDIINTKNELIGFDSSLMEKKRMMALIYVDNILFSFGGSPLGLKFEYFQYAVDSTSAPSVSPTPAPTASTASPIASPTQSPTIPPSNTPSFPPTMTPTDSPSMPSISPSYSPTITPTASPTLSPSIPSISPTVSPTVLPSISPTISPTVFLPGPTYDGIKTEWIGKEGINCGDGYKDLGVDSEYYGIYCERCPEGTAGTYGQCFECGTLQEPNHSSVDCEFVSPWWLYLLETIAGLTCIVGIVHFCYKKTLKVTNEIKQCNESYIQLS